MKLVNNARSILKSDIVWGSSSFLVQDLEWDLFKYEVAWAITNEFTIFAEQIENSLITRREPIKVKRVWDVFTIIERKSQDCVWNDTVSPKVREKKEYNFTAWITQISIYASEDDFDSIQSQLDWKATKEDVASWTLIYNASSTWDDDYNVTISSITSYTDWLTIRVKADVANTWECTCEINVLGPIDVKKTQWKDSLVSWDWWASWIATLIYNSTLNVFQYSSQEAIIAIPEVNYLTLNTISAVTVAINEAINVKDESFVVWDAINSESIWLNSDKLKIWIPFHFLKWDLTSLLLRLKRIWSPTDSITYRIETDNAWEPSWTLVNVWANWSFDLSTLTTSFVDTALTLAATFADHNLAWVVLERTSADASNYFAINYTNKTNIDNEVSKMWNGSAWVDVITWTPLQETVDSQRNSSSSVTSTTYFTPNKDITFKEVKFYGTWLTVNLSWTIWTNVWGWVYTFNKKLTSWVQYSLTLTGWNASDCRNVVVYPMVKTNFTINSSTWNSGAWGPNWNFWCPYYYTMAEEESLDFPTLKAYSTPSKLIQSLWQLARANDVNEKITTWLAVSWVSKFQDMVMANVWNKWGFSGLTKNSTYYLQDTPWAIWTSPWTNSVIIWATKNDTSILTLNLD